MHVVVSLASFTVVSGSLVCSDMVAFGHSLATNSPKIKCHQPKQMLWYM